MDQPLSQNLSTPSTSHTGVMLSTSTPMAFVPMTEWTNLLKENEELRKKVSELEGNKLQLTAELTSRLYEIELLKKENEELRQRIKILEADNTKIKQELSETKKELSETKQELSETKQELHKTKQNVDILNQQVEHLVQRMTKTDNDNLFRKMLIAIQRSEST